MPTGLAVDGVRDREWMIVDGGGRFVTQREIPRLALVESRTQSGAVTLHIPGRDPVTPKRTGSAGKVVVWSAHVRGFDGGDEAADALSAFTGRALRLVGFDDALPRRCNPDYAGDSGATTLYSDGYPVLVIGQASLDDLNDRLADRGIAEVPMNRFRPNLVVDGLPPFDEDHLDSLVCRDVELKLVKRCTRCEITTTDQATGHRYEEPLRTLSTFRHDDRLAGVTFGMNAIVVRGAGATIAVGDAMEAKYRF
jgi:uncharacterized protein YcbX